MGSTIGYRRLLADFHFLGDSDRASVSGDGVGGSPALRLVRSVSINRLLLISPVVEPALSVADRERQNLQVHWRKLQQAYGRR